jgi:hypothetical protein
VVDRCSDNFGDDPMLRTKGEYGSNMENEVDKCTTKDSITKEQGSRVQGVLLLNR